jgi:hypothetical protein
MPDNTPLSADNKRKLVGPMKAKKKVAKKPAAKKPAAKKTTRKTPKK